MDRNNIFYFQQSDVQEDKNVVNLSEEVIQDVAQAFNEVSLTYTDNHNGQYKLILKSLSS